MEGYTTIRMKKETKEKLVKMRANEQENYDDVLNRLMGTNEPAKPSA
ncbi:MAG: DUF7557 family protein [Candidatus Bilamarchaeaceae archaeon]